MALENYPDIDFIEGYTLDQLNSEMLSWFREKYEEVTGKPVALGDADWRKLILQTCAYYIYQGYALTDKAGKMGLLKYATGDFLDNLGALKRVTRLEAKGATVQMRFLMNAERPVATPIPAGTRVSAGDGIYFATDEYAEITPGNTNALVNATCLTPGTAGNGYAEFEIHYMADPVPFIDRVENLGTPVGGRDRESDDDFRERIYLVPDAYTDAGSKGGYEYYVREFDSTIADVQATSPTEGEAVIRVLLQHGQLPGQSFLDALAAYMEEKEVRKLTDHVTILAPTAETFDVRVTYYINSSDRARATAIQDQVFSAASEYLEWQQGKIDRDINPDELVKRIIAAGAKRVEVTAPVRTVLTGGKVAQVGTMSVGYGGLEDD